MEEKVDGSIKRLIAIFVPEFNAAPFMGIVKKDALITSVVAYLGMALGYVNKGLLFVIFLSPQEIGLVNLIASVAVLYAQFSSLGTFNTVWRFFPLLQNQEKKHHGFLSFNMLIALFGGVAVALISVIFSEPIKAYYEVKSPLFADYFLWVIPTGMAVLIFMLLDNYTRAIQKSVFSTFANDIVLRILTTAAIFIYVADWMDFNQFVIVTCLLQWVPTMLVALYIRYLGEGSFNPRKIAIPRKLQKIMFNYSAFNYLNSMGTSVIMTIDALMVAGMIGMKETGIYTTVTFVSRALTIPYGSIMRVSAPLIPKFWKNRDMQGMQQLYKKVSSVSLVIGLALFLYVWINRVDLFALLPPEFEAGIYVFLFIMIGRIIDMYCGLNGTILITSRKFRYDVLFTAALLVIVVILNQQMIPVWGMAGAAISTAVAYLLFNLARVLFVWIKFDIHPFTASQLSVLLLFAGAIAFFEFVPVQLGNPFLSIFVKCALATMLFPVVIYWFKMEPEITEYANAVLRRLKGGKKKK